MKRKVPGDFSGSCFTQFKFPSEATGFASADKWFEWFDRLVDCSGSVLKCHLLEAVRHQLRVRSNSFAAFLVLYHHTSDRVNSIESQHKRMLTKALKLPENSTKSNHSVRFHSISPSTAQKPNIPQILPGHMAGFDDERQQNEVKAIGFRKNLHLFKHASLQQRSAFFRRSWMCKQLG